MRAGKVRLILRNTGAAAVAVVLCCALNGCLVAGYTSGAGGWVWPGSLVATLVLLLAWWLMRR